jgi:hypothetical protein
MNKKQAYAVAKEMAMNNGQEFHFAALLWRRGKLIKIGINSQRTSTSFQRFYRTRIILEAISAHAEMDALQVAKLGDFLEVLRWDSKGQRRNAKPCHFCQLRINRFGVETRYKDEEGKWKILT